MVFINSLESILSIIIMIFLGYILTQRGVFNENTGKAFTTLVLKISLPAYMVWNLTNTFDQEKLLHLVGGITIPFISMLACYSVGWLISKLIGIEAKHQGVFNCMFFVSNTIFIGLPINLALFGDKSIPYVLLYYIANTTLFWTLGIYLISRDGSDSTPRLFSYQNLKHIFSPPLLGFIVGILLVIADSKLPPFISDVCKYLGNCTTPLSMLFIGISIYSVKPDEIHVSKDVVALVLGRFIIAPFIVFLLTLLIPVPSLMKEVFIVQSAMPIIASASIIAKAYNADYKYAALMTTVTTVIAMVMIPIYMVIFTYLAI
ncbi:putative transporter YfdV [Sporomusa ovata DSM 2662]|uniref:Malate permease n=1 Tax=Sporomusa ovata TaxID=2378 RepID=A0A0U1KXS9_9FIRM|nr:AEC family transporter [Sporomusa ovata]EQB28712.1 putative permease [Sporomusa ovata DSM 2662]CQR72220.1 Malate permease [Sporomusa ovata]